MGNTLESIRQQCSEKGWNGYDCPPISELVLSRAKQIEPHIPKDFELFPAGDNSVQWESGDDNICIEVYEDVVYVSSATEFEDSVPYKSIEEAIERIKKLGDTENT